MPCLSAVSDVSTNAPNRPVKGEMLSLPCSHDSYQPTLQHLHLPGTVMTLTLLCVVYACSHRHASQQPAESASDLRVPGNREAATTVLCHRITASHRPPPPPGSHHHPHHHHHHHQNAPTTTATAATTTTTATTTSTATATATPTTTTTTTMTTTVRPRLRRRLLLQTTK